MKRYSISDIHGCLNTFNALLLKINLSKEDELYILGDCVDKGPDSRGVLDKLMSLIENGYKVRVLMGNHEAMALDDMYSSYEYSESQMLFMRNMEWYIEIDDYFLVHAGFSPSNPFGSKMGMLWSRTPFYNESIFKGKKIIHGHTPKHIDNIKNSLVGDARVIGIDNGCFVAERKGSGYGHLIALDLDSMEIHRVKCVDMIEYGQ